MGIKGGEKTKTERVHEMEQHLMSGRAMTPEWYEDTFQMSRKTMKRDLDDLGLMGIDIIEENTPLGPRYTVASSSRKLTVQHPLESVFAMFLGRGMFDFLEGTILEKSFSDVYASMEKQLSNPADIDNRRKLAKKLYMVHEGPKKYDPETSQYLETILNALRHEYSLEGDYVSSAGEQHLITINPYTLVAFRRGLYLLGAVREWHGAVRCFAIERFANLTMTGGRFIYPADFDPRKYFESALFMDAGEPTRVTLLFAPGAENFIGLRQYHPSQQFIQKKDGRFQMTMDVKIGYELLHWILSFGANVQVVSPKSLQKQVADALQAALSQY